MRALKTLFVLTLVHSIDITLYSIHLLLDQPHCGPPVKKCSHLCYKSFIATKKEEKEKGNYTWTKKHLVTYSLHTATWRISPWRSGLLHVRSWRSRAAAESEGETDGLPAEVLITGILARCWAGEINLQRPFFFSFFFFTDCGNCWLRLDSSLTLPLLSLLSHQSTFLSP